MSSARRESRARCWIPLYTTMVMAARMAIMTTTISSSTSVNPWLFLRAIDIGSVEEANPCVKPLKL